MTRIITALFTVVLLLTSCATRNLSSQSYSRTLLVPQQSNYVQEAERRVLVEENRRTVESLQRERVRVVLKDKQRLKGVVASVGQDSFILQTDDQPQEIAFVDVQSVKKFTPINASKIAIVVGVVLSGIFLAIARASSD